MIFLWPCLFKVRVFFSVVLSFSIDVLCLMWCCVGACILDLSRPSSGFEEGLDWRASLESVLDLSVEERQVFALNWTATGRKKNNFPHLLFFFLGWRPFPLSTDKGQLTFSTDFAKNSFSQRLNILILFNWKFFVQLGCILFIWVLIIDTDCLPKTQVCTSTISVYKYYKWVYLTPDRVKGTLQ